jgi:hypothetical protein
MSTVSARPICAAHVAHGLPGRPRPVRPATARRCLRAHTGAVTAFRTRIAARPAVALPWRRWSKGRHSSIHGREATRRASGWRRQLTGASCLREGWKNRDDGGVLRRGGGSGGRQGPMSGWRGRELGSTFHGRKSGKRGLRFRSPWKSSRRRRRLDSDGGALRAWMMAWSGRACARRRHGSNSWGRDRKGCRDAGARSRQRP